MAWTVAFALLGALLFALLIAPVLCSLLFSDGNQGMAQPGAANAAEALPPHARLVLRPHEIHAWAWGWLALASCCSWPSADSSAPNFLPHLDEGAIWVRGTLAPSTGPTAGIARRQARRASSCRSFPRSRRSSARSAVPTTAAMPAASTTPSFSSICCPRSKWRSRVQNERRTDRRHGQGSATRFPASTGIFRSRFPTTSKKPSAASKANWRSSCSAAT